MHCFYSKTTCSYKNAELCDVALLLSAEMQMIVPQFFNARGDHKWRKTKNNQINKQPGNNRARTIAVMVWFHSKRHMLT